MCTCEFTPHETSFLRNYFGSNMAAATMLPSQSWCHWQWFQPMADDGGEQSGGHSWEDGGEQGDGHSWFCQNQVEPHVYWLTDPPTVPLHERWDIECTQELQKQELQNQEQATTKMPSSSSSHATTQMPASSSTQPAVPGDRHRGSGKKRPSGRYGVRGGKQNPNVEWHTMESQAEREGWIKEFRLHFPKPEKH